LHKKSQVNSLDTLNSFLEETRQKLEIDESARSDVIKRTELELIKQNKILFKEFTRMFKDKIKELEQLLQMERVSNSGSDHNIEKRLVKIEDNINNIFGPSINAKMDELLLRLDEIRENMKIKSEEKK